LTSVSWAPLSTYLLRFLIRQPVRPRGSPAVCLVLASSSQRSFPQKPLPSFLPLFPSLAGCKNTTFSPTHKHFFCLFCKISAIKLCFNKKNFSWTGKNYDIALLLIYRDGNNAVFVAKIYGENIGFIHQPPAYSCTRQWDKAVK